MSQTVVDLKNFKRVAVCSTGTVDTSQGGSGIFNYYILDALLKQNIDVSIFLLVGKKFFEDGVESEDMRQMRSRGVSIIQIKAEDQISKLSFGQRFLEQSHRVSLCKSYVHDNFCIFKKFDGIIAHDLGWILALSDISVPVVGVLGDPLVGRLRYSVDGGAFGFFRKLWCLLKAWSLDRPSVYRWLAQQLNGKVQLGSLSPHHARELNERGVSCQHYFWFSPLISEGYSLDRRFGSNIFNDKFTLLHVGNVSSTASKNMLKYWREKLIPYLDALNIPIELRLVGLNDGRPIQGSKNITVTYLGHLKNLDEEFFCCDAYFAPTQYPVGTRTRILTALSYGVPVVSDSSASFGLPYLRNGYDIVYADTPEDVASAIYKLFNKREMLKVIGLNGANTWKKLYHPVENSNAIISRLNHY